MTDDALQLTLPGDLPLSDNSPHRWLAQSFPTDMPPLPPISEAHQAFLEGVHRCSHLLDDLEDALRAMGRAQGPLGPPVWVHTLSDDEPRCYLCGGLIDPFGDEKRFLGELRPTKDHKIPRALGGTDDPENLGLAHMDCNARKGTSRLSDLLLPLRAPSGYDEQVIRQRLEQFREYQAAFGRAKAAREAYYAFHPEVSESSLEDLVISYLDDDTWSERFDTWALIPIPDPWLAYLNDAEALEQKVHTRFKRLNEAYLERDPSLITTPELPVRTLQPLSMVTIPYPPDSAGQAQAVVSFLSSHHRALCRMLVTANDQEVATRTMERTVTLRPEPDNPHDPWAVRVEFAGLTIGYLPRHDTARFRDIATSLTGSQDVLLDCQARLTWDESSSRTVHLC